MVVIVVCLWTSFSWFLHFAISNTFGHVFKRSQSHALQEKAFVVVVVVVHVLHLLKKAKLKQY